jgi:hypothetical protein
LQKDGMWIHDLEVRTGRQVFAVKVGADTDTVTASTGDTADADHESAGADDLTSLKQPSAADNFAADVMTDGIGNARFACRGRSHGRGGRDASAERRRLCRRLGN